MTSFCRFWDLESCHYSETRIYKPYLFLLFHLWADASNFNVLEGSKPRFYESFRCVLANPFFKVLI
eukprot:UN28110